MKQAVIIAGAVASASCAVALMAGTPTKPPQARPQASSEDAPTTRFEDRRTTRRGSAHPNILVVVVDDLGIDQWSFPPFGWNGQPNSPDMPVLAEIATQSVSFTNFWATPECSPTRAALLTGRHGFRTNVVTAIVDPMLPMVQLHPDEDTLPKLLRTKGYLSGMLGKYHLGGGPANTPPGYGYEAPVSTTGLDYYDGYWDLPPSIDQTIGGQSPGGGFDCGTVLGIDTRGAACFPDGTCISDINPVQAMAMGGTPLLRPDGTLAASCDEGDCGLVDFDMENAYYVWPRTTTDASGADHRSSPQREYLTSFISRRSVEWIDEARATGKPWIAFTTHSSAHTPIQTPPPSLTGLQPNNFSCSLSAGLEFREQFRLMVESVDRSIGDMLVDLGLASWTENGFELGDLAAANTMLIVLNDNGTYGLDVLLPFDPTRAKQTVYETGVRSPCMIAGPQVVAPGRVVDETVSVVDLFGLVCDTAGVDWQALDTPTHRIDALPMSGYLTSESYPPQRDFNFALYRQGTFVEGAVGSCIVNGGVVDGLMGDPQLCTDNGGCWASPEATAPYSITNYCDLMSTDPDDALFECDGVVYCTLPPSMQAEGLCPEGSTPINPPTLAQYAVRRGLWKLVVVESPECLAPDDCSLRLYRLLRPEPPHQPGIELPDGAPDVWDPLNDDMPPEAVEAFDALKAELVSLLLSEPKSPADGNLDGVVDALDVEGVLEEWGAMGFWDANTDGVVNAYDLAEVLDAWGPVLPSPDLVPSCLLATPRTLVRDYTFETGLADAAGSGIDAVSLGGGIFDGQYEFGPNGGLVLPLGGLPLEDYAIEIEVAIDGNEFPFSKIVDFDSRAQDRGLYREPHGGVFLLAPSTTSASRRKLALGETHLVRLARDGASRALTLEIDGVLQWIHLDSGGSAVPATDELVLFADDAVTNFVETCSGRIESVRILTADP
jgi:hypothetical protein